MLVRVRIQIPLLEQTLKDSTAIKPTTPAPNRRILNAPPYTKWQLNALNPTCRIRFHIRNILHDPKSRGRDFNNETKIEVTLGTCSLKCQFNVGGFQMKKFYYSIHLKSCVTSRRRNLYIHTLSRYNHDEVLQTPVRHVNYCGARNLSNFMKTQVTTPRCLICFYKISKITKTTLRYNTVWGF